MALSTINTKKELYIYIDFYISLKQNIIISISLKGKKKLFAGSTVPAKHSGFRMLEKNLGCFDRFSYSGLSVNMKDLFVFSVHTFHYCIYQSYQS